MQRRTFLKSVAVGTAAGLCKGDERPTAPKTRSSLDPAAVARELAGHRIAKIEAKRSNDRYARSLGKSRTSKGFGRGFGRQILPTHGARNRPNARRRPWRRTAEPNRCFCL